ncbi:Abi family protein [Simplicispira metamorpha]|nr:Abi family protein [Simplicispira metamorpha]
MAFSFVAPQMRFSKTAEKPSDLLARIVDRGATFQDQSKAFAALSRIGYYRLSGYMLPFQTGHQPDPHRFKPGTTFESVLALYEFDCKLRGLLMLAIEPIEVAFRSAMCNKLALLHGPHWHTDSSLFDAKEWSDLLLRIAGALDFDIDSNARKSRAKVDTHLFIDHYYRKYTSPPMPPCWMFMEVASFGLVAKMFKNLKNQSDRKAIALEFNFLDRKPIDEAILGSWIHGLSVLRNRCAHHSQLVYRNHPFTPATTKNSSVGHLLQAQNRKVREFLVTTAILNRASNQKSSWVRQLHFLFDATSGVDIERAIGFQGAWRDDPLWKMAWF